MFRVLRAPPKNATQFVVFSPIFSVNVIEVRRFSIEFIYSVNFMNEKSVGPVSVVGVRKSQAVSLLVNTQVWIREGPTISNSCIVFNNLFFIEMIL